MGIHDFALFVAAGLMLNLTPGPDMAYIAARGANGRFRGRPRGDARHHGRLRRAHARRGGRVVGAARDVGDGIRHREVVRCRLSAVRGDPAAGRLRARRCGAHGGARARRRAACASLSRSLRHQHLQSEGRAVLPGLPAAIHRRVRAVEGAGIRRAGLRVQFQQPVRQRSGRLAGRSRGRGARAGGAAARWLSGAVGALFVALAVRLALAERT